MFRCLAQGATASRMRSATRRLRAYELINTFGLLNQIEQVHSREVLMPFMGARCSTCTRLAAIDNNSGKIGGKTNFEGLWPPYEYGSGDGHRLSVACDIGGQIVIDFIEMRDPEHYRG